MKLLFVILIVTLYFPACSGQPPVSHKKVTDDYTPAFSSDQLDSQLNKAYKKKDFTEFFSNWQGMKPNSGEFTNQNDTVKAVYSIFKLFYQPLDLLKLGGWEWGNRLNEGAKYVAVQNKIFIAFDTSQVIDEFRWNNKVTDSILNFRPPVDLPIDQVLYLTPEYEDALNAFLGTESTAFGEGGIMNTSRAKGESEKRYKALRPYLPILHGHWGGYWHISTHPVASLIIFTPELDRATILFRVGYQGGQASFKKTGGTWSMTDSGATWIE